MQNFVNEGKTINLKNAGGVTLEGGSLVVIGGIVGIPVASISPGETGALRVEGVFILPKAALSLDQGKPLYWDKAAGKATSVASTGSSETLVVNAPLGVAWTPAGAGDPSVRVKINV